MSIVEIPLLRESAQFRERLHAGTVTFQDSRYRALERVNWSHRYATGFYQTEAELFALDSRRYLDRDKLPPASLEDVFSQRVSGGEVVRTCVKVIGHRMFRLLGQVGKLLRPLPQFDTYRKCYVDDIELAFPPNEPGVLRFVYPFPLSLQRQWRYLKGLKRTDKRFALTGNPYGWADLFRFIRMRDVKTLMRLENRAQIAMARQLRAVGISQVQVSDEFNLGSLPFARCMRHWGIKVINSAHGVGKYLPAHAYEEFRILTRQQARYYVSTRPCAYSIRLLNVESENGSPPVAGSADTDRIRLVYLSQSFANVASIVEENEQLAVSVIASGLGSRTDIELLFKPHPTEIDRPPPKGFKRLKSLGSVNGKQGTIFVSQFSTCQIDPNFQGEKYLLRGRLIHPEISFDDVENILTVKQLVDLLVHRADKLSRGHPPIAQHP
jgi:hypothetical protein